MKIADNAVQAIDSFQRRNRLAGFVYAVIKKYGDDQAGYQAALLTYYGFLSLFPLLLVLTTLAGIVANEHPHLKETIVKSLTDYFPVLGNQLAENIQTLQKRGLALVIGLLFTFYGARGVADAFRQGVNHIWHVPFERRDSFPKSALKSTSLVVLGGAGLLIASISASTATGVGHGWPVYVLAAAVNLFVLFWVFIIVLNLSLPKHVTIKELRAGAATSAIGLVTLQSLGGYLLGRQLKNFDALYSNFALTLGLLFWIYLQAQVIYYAVEIAHVRSHGLYPRSLTGKDLTEADKRAYDRQAKKEKVIPSEKISTSFRKNR